MIRVNIVIVRNLVLSHFGISCMALRQCMANSKVLHDITKTGDHNTCEQKGECPDVLTKHETENSEALIIFDYVT